LEYEDDLSNTLLMNHLVNYSGIETTNHCQLVALAHWYMGSLNRSEQDLIERHPPLECANFEQT